MDFSLMISMYAHIDDWDGIHQLEKVLGASVASKFLFAQMVDD